MKIQRPLPAETNMQGGDGGGSRAGRACGALYQTGGGSQQERAATVSLTCIRDPCGEPSQTRARIASPCYSRDATTQTPPLPFERTTLRRSGEFFTCFPPSRMNHYSRHTAPGKTKKRFLCDTCHSSPHTLNSMIAIAASARFAASPGVPIFWPST